MWKQHARTDGIALADVVLVLKNKLKKRQGHMLGSVQKLDEGDKDDGSNAVYVFECDKLPLPWNGPDATIEERFLFYAVGTEIYISGPVARQMCHGKRTDAKCPAKGVVVEELHKSTKWYRVSTDLEPTWTYYRPNKPCPDIKQFMEGIFQAIAKVEQEAEKKFREKIHQVRLQIKEVFPDGEGGAPYMMGIMAMEQEPYSGALSEAKLHSFVAMLGPTGPTAHVTAPAAATVDAILQALQPRVVQMIGKEVYKQEEALRERMREYEETSRKRMREEEDIFVKLLKEEEDALRARMQAEEEAHEKRMQARQEAFVRQGNQLVLNQIEKVDLLNKRLHGL